eukprot:SAG22_NODE_9166_length_606_cov_0.790927_1_plen_143_part_01
MPAQLTADGRRGTPWNGGVHHSDLRPYTEIYIARCAGLGRKEELARYRKEWAAAVKNAPGTMTTGRWPEATYNEITDGRRKDGKPIPDEPGCFRICRKQGDAAVYVGLAGTSLLAELRSEQTRCIKAKEPGLGTKMQPGEYAQ